MLRELKGFVSGGYFALSLLCIVALCDVSKKKDEEIEELKKQLALYKGEEVNE